MRSLRLNIVALILFIAAGVLLWVMAPQIVESVLHRQLQKRGFTGIDVRVDSVSTQKLALESMELRAPDNSWQVNGVNVEFTFNWQELVNGTLDKISVEKLTIDHDPVSKKSSNAFSIRPLLFILNPSWQERLPFSTVDISRFLLRSSQSATEIELNGRGQLQKQLSALNAQIDFYTKNNNTRSLSLDWRENEGLSVETAPLATTDTAPAFIRVKPAGNDQLTGRIKLDLDGLRQWVAPLITTALPFEGDGLFEADWRIQEQADGRSTLTATASGRDLQWFDTRVDDIRVSLNGSIVQTDQGFEFAFDKDNHAQLNGISTGDFQVASLRAEPEGRVRSSPGLFSVFSQPESTLFLQGFRQAGLSIHNATINWPGELTIDGDRLAVQIQRGAEVEFNEFDSGELKIAAGSSRFAASVRRETNAYDIQLHSSESNLDNVELAGLKADKAVVRLMGDLQTNDNQSTFNLAQDSEVNLSTLTAKNTSVKNFASSLSGAIEKTQEVFRWRDAQADATFDDVNVSDYSVAGGALSWTGSLRSQPDETIIELNPDSVMSLNGISSDLLNVNDISWPLSGSIKSSQGVSVLNLTPTSMLTAEKLKVADIAINKASFKPQQKEILLFINDANAWSVKTKNWRANLTSFTWQEYPITPESMSINFEVNGASNGAWAARSHVKTDLIKTLLENREIALLDIDAKVMADNKKVAAQTEFSMLPDIGRVTSELNYQTSDKTGGITIKPVSIDLSESELAMSDFWQPWPYDFDLVTGMVTLDGHVQWDSSEEKTNINVETEISIERGGGFYREILFSGLTTKLPLQVFPTINTRHSALVNVNQIDFGLPISNAQAGISLHESNNGPLPGLMVDEVSAGFMGGEIKSEKLQLDFNRDQNSVMIDVENLDIEQIMQLQEFDGLAASGRVNGRIPVDLRADGIYIEQGEVFALSPGGQIHYAPEGGTKSIEDAAPGTEIVFKALKDFRYDVMKADTFYKPNGELLLQMHLEGTSPELETTRPVHVNINLEQNVLSLLRSLRLVEGLNEKLDERVREHYETIRQ